MNTRSLQIISALSFGLSLGLTCPGYATPSGGDLYGHITSKTGAGHMVTVMSQIKPTPQLWFEKYDLAVGKLRPTQADRVILGRPSDRELERVRQWEATATKVAKNYRKLAQIIRSIPAPAGSQSIGQYRGLIADWYDDAASVYEDLVRPRPAFRTMEELDGCLGDIKSRAEEIGKTHLNLLSMETELRQSYQVSPPSYDDALENYVTSATK